MLKKVSGIFCILIGVCMVSMWSFLLISENVPELKNEPFRIALHLVSEFGTAIILIVSGIGLIMLKRWAERVFLISMGALMYSVLNAAGLYGQQSNIAMVMMFAAILVCSVAFAIFNRPSGNTD